MPLTKNRNDLIAERCWSGRTGTTGNRVCLQGHQGFESLPLRQTFTPSLPRITKISNRESGSCTRLGETEQVSSGQLHQPNRREEAGSTPTFRKAALQVHRINLPTWRNRKYAAHWISTLETHVFPTTGGHEGRRHQEKGCTCMPYIDMDREA